MKLAEILQAFRIAADDVSSGAVQGGDRLFSRDAALMWLREAEDEAAMRKRLLPESCHAPMCTVPLAAGQQAVKLHERWFLVTAAWYRDEGCALRNRTTLKIRSRAAMDAWRPDWRTDDTRPPFGAIIKGGTLLLAGHTNRPGTLQLEGFRLPLREIEDRDDASPEIHTIHHRHLVDWMLYRGYSVPDSEVLNPAEAQAALARFERYFGLSVDADLHQDSVDDQVHHNQAWW